jgi:CRP/FNR family transcriptional regulator, cyclic AMP receptor protein
VQEESDSQRNVRVQSCIRPVNAAVLTAGPDVIRRLAQALLRLSGTQSEANFRKIEITQKDLASMIGMSRESTNKQLREWEDRKWVRLERNVIVILSTADLEAIAEGDER